MSVVYDNDNIFAKMVNGDVPCDKVHEDDSVLAFHDINPAAPIHVLVVPKTNHLSFDDFVQHAGADVVASFFQSIQQIAQKLNVVDSGYRLITNHGENASQTVPHFHVHILAGKPLGGLLPDDKLIR